jgi:hypothetical protein
MIHYDPNTRIVMMSLVDLEHCGFSHDDFELELEASLQQIPDGARWPLAILVNVAGGHILTPQTSEASLRATQAAEVQFRVLLEKIGFSDY